MIVLRMIVKIANFLWALRDFVARKMARGERRKKNRKAKKRRMFINEPKKNGNFSLISKGISGILHHRYRKFKLNKMIPKTPIRIEKNKLKF